MLAVSGPPKKIKVVEMKVATSPLPSWGTKCGQSGYVILAVLATPQNLGGNQIEGFCFVSGTRQHQKKKTLLLTLRKIFFREF